jgi:hypothetical protein
LRAPTLLILGAGSCFDFHFPLGPKLVQNISEATRIEYDGYRFLGGHPTLVELLDRTRSQNASVFNRYLTACDHISRNVGYSSSIDSFLYSNQSDQDVVLIAKFAISSIISACEKRSTLFVEEHKIGRFDAQQLSGTWLNKLFATVHAPVEEDVKDIFANLRVVSFNYDRVFEQYLAIALTNFYRLGSAQARELVDGIRVSHVYGSLGSLMPSHQEHAPFGTFDHDPETNARRIKTFHESVDSDVLNDVRTKIFECDRVFALGFSYANINTGFLEQCAEDLNGSKQVHGTSYEMSVQNIDVARERMDAIFGLRTNSVRLLPVTCERFFDDLSLIV